MNWRQDSVIVTSFVGKSVHSLETDVILYDMGQHAISHPKCVTDSHMISNFINNATQETENHRAFNNFSYKNTKCDCLRETKI